jgi:antitoxin component YwqK of YwqJK toxin-antitoxin module
VFWRLLASAAVLTAAAGIYFNFQPREVESGDPHLQVEADVTFFKGAPFTGIAVEHYFNGEIYKRLAYEDGKLEGESREYHFGAKPRAILHYHRGLKSGLQTVWYAEGPKRSENHFKNGVLEGEQTEWHLNGSLFQRLFYVDGVEKERKILYPGGEIFTNTRIRGQRKFGLDSGELCMQNKREGER